MNIDRLPPKIIRRLLIAPLVFCLCLLVLLISPLLLVASAALDIALPGNWRTLRLTTFIVVYILLETISFIALFFLWSLAGFGSAMRTEPVQKAHYSYMRWWLSTTEKVVRKLFHLRIYIEDRPVPRPGPLLVFSRHAGPGNSLLLIGTILVGYKRRPRIVMLAKVQWEPLFDVMLNRLPNRFIQHDPSRRDIYLAAIGELASGLADMDAFVLFPEGKDFTPRVRRRAIDYLKGKGHSLAAERAEKMAHVLPPRHGGVRAAIQNAPHADVVFVAHSVLEDVGTFKQIWSNIPLEHSLHARYWRVPAAEVPSEQEELIEWLYQWWERIDAWIAARSTVSPGA